MISKKNNAVCAFMGGPNYLKNTHFNHLTGVEFELIGLDDLKFHESWHWLIPVWSKVRHEMTPGMIIAAISCIDENRLNDLFMLISQVCIDWCKSKNLKLD